MKARGGGSRLEEGGGGECRIEPSELVEGVKKRRKGLKGGED